MIDIKLLEQLCLCNGISGDEGNVRNLILTRLKTVPMILKQIISATLLCLKGKKVCKKQTYGVGTYG